MDMPVTEEQIRTLAYYLWERDGSPDGRAEEYWDKAREQLGVVTPGSASQDPAEPAAGDAA